MTRTIDAAARSDQPRESAAEAIHIENLHKRFGELEVLKGVSLSARDGDVVAIIGGSGSGKSTLLRCLIGLHPTRRGRTLVDGSEARSRKDWIDRRTHAAWVPQRQDPGRFPLRVSELLASSGAVDESRVAAERLGLAHLASRPLSTLSGGQLQRAFLARALGAIAGGRASVLLADEPTASLDFAGRDQVVAELIAIPASVLVVTHDRAVADACDRCYEMAGGEAREVR